MCSTSTENDLTSTSARGNFNIGYNFFYISSISSHISRDTEQCSRPELQPLHGYRNGCSRLPKPSTRPFQEILVLQIFLQGCRSILPIVKGALRYCPDLT